jgi:hypothetical protein
VARDAERLFVRIIAEHGASKPNVPPIPVSRHTKDIVGRLLRVHEAMVTLGFPRWDVQSTAQEARDLVSIVLPSLYMELRRASRVRGEVREGRLDRDERQAFLQSLPDRLSDLDDGDKSEVAEWFRLVDDALRPPPWVAALEGMAGSAATRSFFDQHASSQREVLQSIDSMDLGAFIARMAQWGVRTEDLDVVARGLHAGANLISGEIPTGYEPDDDMVQAELLRQARIVHTLIYEGPIALASMRMLPFLLHADRHPWLGDFVDGSADDTLSLINHYHPGPDAFVVAAGIWSVLSMEQSVDAFVGRHHVCGDVPLRDALVPSLSDAKRRQREDQAWQDGRGGGLRPHDPPLNDRDWHLWLISRYQVRRTPMALLDPPEEAAMIDALLRREYPELLRWFHDTHSFACRLGLGEPDARGRRDRSRVPGNEVALEWQIARGFDTVQRLEGGLAGNAYTSSDVRSADDPVRPFDAMPRFAEVLAALGPVGDLLRTRFGLETMGSLVWPVLDDPDQERLLGLDR